MLGGSFVSDKLADGRSYRILTVIDQFTRECIALVAERSMSGAQVAATFTQAIAEREATPRSITLDNGSEFAGRVVEAWAMEHGIQLCLYAEMMGGSAKIMAKARELNEHGKYRYSVEILNKLVYAEPQNRLRTCSPTPTNSLATSTRAHRCATASSRELKNCGTASSR